jgi:hypothetical protein
LLGVMFVVVFNLINHWLFSIGIFPWFMLAATPLFFPPDSLRRVWLKVRDRIKTSLPEVGARRMRHEPRGEACARQDLMVRSLSRSQRLTVALLGIYAAGQLLWPFRHFLYPGDVSWTEEGHQFSWHMKLRTKSELALFTATDPITGQSWEIDPSHYLTTWQRSEMQGDPEMILQFAHHVAADLYRQGYEQIEVRAQVKVSLNGRPYQDLIDSNINLAAEPRSILPARWILPLTEPLPPPGARRGYAAIDPAIGQDDD